MGGTTKHEFGWKHHIGRSVRAAIRQAQRQWELARWFRSSAVSPSNAAQGGLLPRRIKRRLSAQGFFPDKYSFYGFDKRDDWPSFLSDRQMLMSSWIDGKYTVLLEDKLVFYQVMRELVRVPQVFLSVNHGIPSWIHGDIPPGGDISGLLERQRNVVVKPVLGGQGEGVSLLSAQDGAWLQDGEQITADELHTLVYEAGDVVVVEAVEQGPFGNGIYPGSANSMRVVTMLDPDDGVPFIAAARHRFGTDQSDPTDNVSRGGLSCAIDLDTGPLYAVH